MTDILKRFESMIWIGGAVFIGIIIYFIVFKTAGFFVKKSKSPIDNAILKHLRGPSKLIFPLILLNIFFPFIKLSARLQGYLKHILLLLIIGTFAWVIIKIVYVFEEVILSRFDMDTRDNLEARKINTQIQILKKVIISIVSFIALGAMLMTFEKIRYLGTSLLASAGIAGIILGFAAQKSISTLIAGIQVALTQPIRLDDVVIVENEWGRIEEITLTYVVVRIWDLRRLIVPITYFLEKPFQNWTRTSADLLCTVFLYVDYSASIEDIRKHLLDIAKNSGLWDGKICLLQTTNAGEKTIELRALLSAADSSAAWDLRCFVREKLIEFCKKNYPDTFPKLRMEVNNLRNSIQTQIRKKEPIQS